MSTIYEINMSNAQADVNTGRVKQNSKIVEVFSALSAGKRPEVDDKTLDKSVATIKELSSKAIDGDNAARSEINSIIRFSIEPKLLEVVRLHGHISPDRLQRGSHDEDLRIREHRFSIPGIQQRRTLRRCELA